MDQFPPKIIVRDPSLDRYIICILAIVINGAPVYHMIPALTYEIAHDATRTIGQLPPSETP